MPPKFKFTKEEIIDSGFNIVRSCADRLDAKPIESEGALLQFGIEEDRVDAFIAERGFQAVTTVTTAACEQKYFKGASLGRTVSPMFNFVYAAVSPQSSKQ